MESTQNVPVGTDAGAEAASRATQGSGDVTSPAERTPEFVPDSQPPPGASTSDPTGAPRANHSNRPTQN